MRDLGTLQVQSLIVHEIPRMMGDAAAQPTLSEIESPLTQNLKNYFREKIVRSLAMAAFDVSFDAGLTSPVPNLVFNNLMSADDDFVAMSQELARHLCATQNRVNSPGLLTVIQTLIENRRSLAILKLEKEEGVRAEQVTLEGKTTFSIEHIKELMLTDKTKVFKAGLFVQEGTDLELIDGLVSDNQRPFIAEIEVADFFLKKFLGCKLQQSPDVTTKQFFQASQAFINEKVTDSEAKAQYQIALLAELQKQVVTVHPRTFAEEHLNLDDRQRYIQWLDDRQVPTQIALRKDTSLIESQLKKVQLDFDSGIAVIGPPATFEEHVSVTNIAGGRTKVEIEDKLKRIRS